MPTDIPAHSARLPEIVFIIDVSNQVLLTAGPELDRYATVLARLAEAGAQYGFTPTVIGYADHALRRAFAGSALEVYRRFIAAHGIVEVPYADPAMLDHARRCRGCVVTNDKLRSHGAKRRGVPIVGVDAGALRTPMVHHAASKRSRGRPLPWSLLPSWRRREGTE